MARIFVSFFNNIIDPDNFDALPCFYQGLLSELAQNGNQILYYGHHQWDQNFPKPPVRFLQELKKFNPDFMILFNNSCFDLTPYFDCPIIVWEADSYLYYAHKNVLKKNPDRFHYIVAQSIEQTKISEVFGANAKNIYFLPFSTAITAQDIPQTTNISFIGTNYNFSQTIHQFLLTKPSISQRRQFQQAIKLITEQPFFSNDDVFRTLAITSAKITKNFDAKQILADISGQQRVDLLSRLADLGLAIYGTHSWTQIPYHSELALSYHWDLVYSLKQTQQIYNQSKLSINVNHLQAQTGFSWRVCDVMASNSCLVTQPRADFTQLFPGLQLPTYHSPTEAYQICQKLLRDDQQRKEISLSCQAAIKKNFLFCHRVKDLSEILAVPLVKVAAPSSITNIQKNTWWQKFKKTTNQKSLTTKMKLSSYGLLLAASQIPLLQQLVPSHRSLATKITAAIEFDAFNKH